MSRATPFPLGRTLWHDPKSRLYPARTAIRRFSVTHRHLGSVLDQGNLGSCTGNSLAQVLNTMGAHRVPSRLYKEADAVHFYSRGTNEDEFVGDYPPSDEGSSGNGVCLAAWKDGVLDRYEHCFGLDHTLNTLVLRPVMIGVNWYTGMFFTDTNGFLWPSGQVEGGHEPALIGVNFKLRYVTLLNSWGKHWGRQGRAYMTFDTLDRLLHEDGDVTVPYAK